MPMQMTIPADKVSFGADFPDAYLRISVTNFEHDMKLGGIVIRAFASEDAYNAGKASLWSKDFVLNSIRRPPKDLNGNALIPQVVDGAATGNYTRTIADVTDILTKQEDGTFKDEQGATVEVVQGWPTFTDLIDGLVIQQAHVGMKAYDVLKAAIYTLVSHEPDFKTATVA